MSLIDTRKRRKKHKKRPRRKVVTQAVKTPAPKPAPKPAPVTTAPKPVTTPTPTPSTTPTTPSTPTTTPTQPAATGLPTTRERLLLNRLGTGYTTTALTALRSVGGPDQWLEQQLKPETVPEHPFVATIDSWFPRLRRTALAQWNSQLNGEPDGWLQGHDLGNWSILRRVYSRRSVLETMVELWSNHLNIPVSNQLNSWVWRSDYDTTIRKYALGRYEDLLIATALHPAMSLYLDNWRSTKGKLNENQGRELLECHTVGQEAGYTEDMVKASAILLSGYTVDWLKTFEPRYDATAHATGPVRVLGFSHANADSDGRGATLAYLKYLANHPETARRIATTIATSFVRDDPSDALVSALAQVYLDSGTDTAAVLRALVQHPEFLTSEGLKVRPPFADLVATARVLEVDVNLAPSGSAWSFQANYTMKPAVYTWMRPDGAPPTNGAWSSVPRMLNSYAMHADQSSGSWPKGAAYRTSASWLPTPSVRLDALVDHLCRQWLGRPADAQRIAAACAATKLPASEVLTATHAVIRWEFHRLAAVLLDSPDHMTT